MKINKFWAKHEEIIVGPDPNTGIQAARPYRFVAGSTISELDAQEKAFSKAKYIKELINGQTTKKPIDYTVGIREAIVQEIDKHHVVTINRQGADILNAAHTMFIDIDNKGFPNQISWLDRLKYRFKSLTNQSLPLHHIRKVIKKLAFRDLHFRIYQTAAGYRIMVLGETFDPLSARSDSLLKAFGCDPLYHQLCQSQQCYRARLTPKYHRINLKSPKVVFPFPTERERTDLEQWRLQYHERSKGYAVCHLIETKGAAIELPPIVKFHDLVCKADQKHLPLA